MMCREPHAEAVRTKRRQRNMRKIAAAFKGLKS